MCFAYFKMNKFEKNPQKYIKEKCSFLISRGYTLKTFHRNAKICFNFYIRDKENNDKNHIYFLWENEYVDCTFSNVNTSEVNIKTLNISYPPQFDLFTNMEKINFFIDAVSKNIETIDVRPLTPLKQAMKLSNEGKHIEAYSIFEKLYNEEKSATNAFNLLQCSVYCEKIDVEKKLYEKLKCYTPNLKKEPMELSGCFVRLYYGLNLCEVNRSKEAVEIVDYLIDVISHYKITDPTFLFIRGVPSAQLVYGLIKKTFINDDKLLRIYKEKLMSVLDNDTIKYEFTE